MGRSKLAGALTVSSTVPSSCLVYVWTDGIVGAVGRPTEQPLGCASVPCLPDPRSDQVSSSSNVGREDMVCSVSFYGGRVLTASSQIRRRSANIHRNFLSSPLETLYPSFLFSGLSLHSATCILNGFVLQVGATPPPPLRHKTPYSRICIIVVVEALGLYCLPHLVTMFV